MATVTSPRTSPNSPALYRFAAASGVAAGGLTGAPGAIEGFAGETALTSVLLGVSPALAFPLLVALYLRHTRPGDRFGLAAFAVNLIGLGLFGAAAYTLNLALYFLEAAPPTLTRLALIGSAAVFAVGSVMFGVFLARSGAPRVPAVLYAAALPIFALLAPLPDSPLTSALHALVGIALVWLSLDLLRPQE